MAPVLLIGLDPRKIAGFDPTPVELAIAIGHNRFVDAGVDVDTCLVEVDAAARAIIANALQAKPYGVVVVGGGIRKPDDLVELYEPRRGAAPDAVASARDRRRGPNRQELAAIKPADAAQLSRSSQDTP